MKLSDYKQTTLVGPSIGEMVIQSFPGIRENYKEGDEIYTYTNISNLSGSFGYLLVRGDEVIVQQVTGM